MNVTKCIKRWSGSRNPTLKAVTYRGAGTVGKVGELSIYSVERKRTFGAGESGVSCVTTLKFPKNDPSSNRLDKF